MSSHDRRRSISLGHRRTWAPFLSVAASVMGVACSSGGGPSGSGGAGTGGVLATGGATATGGNRATGGATQGATGGRGGSESATGGAVVATGGASMGGSAGGTGGSIAIGGRGGQGAGGQAGAAAADTVTRTASTYKFVHFPVQANSDGVWNGAATAGSQTMTTSYDTVVLENAYLRVTLLPKYGGRVLSIVHKPTNQEMLYQNPAGTPYLMGEGIFYYDYLVIMGGIFPSFPEPEHGKYWNQPYDLKVLSETKDAITVRMSRKDDLPLAKGVPAKYDVGRTDVLVDVDVTLRAGSASLELGTTLTNTQAKAIPKLEYWTVTTLAPGSAPDKPAIPLNTRILASMEKVHLLESSWSWFGTAEERVSGEIFKWKNLAAFKNWVDQGTAFANPDYRANWSGLMNDDKVRGVLRVSDNVKTPGLKLWTFGPQGLNVDVKDSSKWVRPAIEMWHGITPEFWNRGSMTANEVRQWTQTFFPIMGLREVTAANENGAAYLSSAKSGSETTLRVAASLTRPNQTVKAVFKIDGVMVAEEEVVAAAADATNVTATIANSKAPTGAVFSVDFLDGSRTLLSGKATLP